MQLFGVPCWATLGIGGLSSVELPPIVGDVTVFADRDNDPHVQARLDVAVRRLRDEHRRVRVREVRDEIVGIKGADINDLLQRGL